MNDTSTVQVFLVFPTPSTNVCSNIQAPFPDSRGRLNVLTAALNSYLTAFVGLLRR